MDSDKQDREDERVPSAYFMEVSAPRMAGPLDNTEAAVVRSLLKNNGPLRKLLANMSMQRALFGIQCLDADPTNSTEIAKIQGREEGVRLTITALFELLDEEEKKEDKS